MKKFLTALALVSTLGLGLMGLSAPSYADEKAITTTVSVQDAPPIVVADAAPAAEAAAPAPIAEGKVVKSPMVGTFYRSSSPGGAPFVELGAVVKAGDTVCIIEAMKILNEIESDQAGTISQILVENGQAVEYGQPLFVLT